MARPKPGALLAEDLGEVAAVLEARARDTRGELGLDQRLRPLGHRVSATPIIERATSIRSRGGQEQRPARGSVSDGYAATRPPG